MTRSARIVLPVCLGWFGAAAAWCFPFGPPTAYTIAPGDKPGVTCTQCHGGTPLNGGGGSVRITFPNGTTYTPGQTHTLTVTVTDAAASTFGFELTSRLDNSPNNTQAGSFEAGTAQRIVCADNQVQPAAGCGGSGIQWLEHSSPSLTGVFTVRWTAPPAGSAPVHFYVSGNAANGDNTRNGDHIYTAEYVLLPASTATTGVPVVRTVAVAAGGNPAIQCGSWITITGTNFATARTTWDNAIIGNVYPTTLGGATVLINGKPAPISFVNETQINALAPADTALGPVSLVVSNPTGSSAPATVELAAASPGFFTFTDRYVAGVALDSGSSFQYLAPAGSLGSGVQSRAAKPGDTVLLYGTGWGRTTAQLNTAMASSVALPLAHTGGDFTQPTAKVTIGGQPAQIAFIGLVSPGVYQMNVVVPQVAAGDQPVALNLLIGSATAQQVFIPVQ